eukprot:Gb_37423 [translate_table: standard]
MQRMKGSALSILRQGIQRLKCRASNSWSAVQDVFLSSKDVFEGHPVVFTIGSSLAFVGTAWAGYSLRYLHQAKVDQRLESIVQAMTKDCHVNQEEIKRIVNTGNVSYTAYFAAAATSLLFGCGLGWRDGRWHVNRIIRKQQYKLLGLNKAQQWRLLRKPFSRLKASKVKMNTRTIHVNVPNSQPAQPS